MDNSVNRQRRLELDVANIIGLDLRVNSILNLIYENEAVRDRLKIFTISSTVQNSEIT